MQTFLPYPSFSQSAHVLDNKRLGKQRVEALQILNTLLGRSTGWAHHPAVRMWSGHERHLAAYGLAVCKEWISRGYHDTIHHRIFSIVGLQGANHNEDFLNALPPRWLGSDPFHSSHRAALLFKNPSWYSQWGWTEEPKVEYVWPVPEGR